MYTLVDPADAEREPLKRWGKRMFSITIAAGQHLHQLLVQTKTPHEQAARIVMGDSGVEIRADSPRRGDLAIDYDGRTILLLQESMLHALASTTMDVHQTLRGPRLTIVDLKRDPALGGRSSDDGPIGRLWPREVRSPDEQQKQ